MHADVVGNPTTGVCVIMAGGRGTRFWPLSRLRTPKQLLPLGRTSSLLRDTFERVEPLVGADRVLVVTHRAQAEAVARELPELPESGIIAEPVGRNTAPCAALGAGLAARLDPDAPIAFLPADHLIKDDATFTRQLSSAFAAAARDGGVITFGIPTTHPETGYGYLQCGDEIGDGLRRGVAFIEKPDKGRAALFDASNQYFWNGGIFVWHPADFRRALEEHLPDLIRRLSPPLAAVDADDFPDRLAEAYAGCDSVSLDYGVMEKLREFSVLPAEFDWSDLGDWHAWGAAAPELPGGNHGHAELLDLDSRGNILHAPRQKVALLGVEDLVIVSTGDVLLVADRKRAQEIRELTAKLAETAGDDLL